MSKPTIKPKPVQPIREIPLTKGEVAVMEPYLQQAASATRAYQSASAALNAIARTISGRAGAPPEQRFKLDLAGKRLIPVS
jgi:hypothetical protein